MPAAKVEESYFRRREAYGWSSVALRTRHRPKYPRQTYENQQHGYVAILRKRHGSRPTEGRGQVAIENTAQTTQAYFAHDQCGAQQRQSHHTPGCAKTENQPGAKRSLQNPRSGPLESLDGEPIHRTSIHKLDTT